MDITLILIAFCLLIAIVILLLILFRNINKKSFIAEDGSVFKNQADLDLYERLYERTKPLFSIIEVKGSSDNVLGFEKSFLNKLNKAGFQDLKILFKYRTQFKLLSDLINT
tara:strand:+ start:26 stop:358 length:333 start_codon:yes stop_codon:yes gene_type:complete